jgi:pimeloyl-ACP methyl ester carboxylesterase
MQSTGLSMPGLTYVLIPGAGGSAWYWHRLEPELRRRGHAAIAVGLPADDDSAGLPEYADAVVHAASGRADPVLVAQSLGAFTAPLVCARLPVQMLILLNPMIPNPNETPGEWWANTGHREAKRANDIREGRPPDAEFDWRVDFFHDVPPAVLDEASAQGPPRQSETVFGSVCAFNIWPAVPTRVLVGRDDRFFPLEFQR